MKRIISTVTIIILLLTGLDARQNKEILVLLKTNHGNIKIKLYNETPKHRDNFVKLVNQKYYDSLLFHRVIKDFMIQTGDPGSKHAPASKKLGRGGPNYTVPAEINPTKIHKRGALAAARKGDEVNPTKASSGSQFYIVLGKKYTDIDITQSEITLINNRKKSQMREYLLRPENKELKDEITKYQQSGNTSKLDSIGQIISKIVDEKHKNEPIIKFTEGQRNIYKTLGGTPFLDMDYTVFGEVVEGMDVVDKIGAVETLPGDRPKNDVIIISARVVKE